MIKFPTFLIGCLLLHAAFVATATIASTSSSLSSSPANELTTASSKIEVEDKTPMESAKINWQPVWDWEHQMPPGIHVRELIPEANNAASSEDIAFDDVDDDSSAAAAVVVDNCQAQQELKPVSVSLQSNIDVEQQDAAAIVKGPQGLYYEPVQEIVHVHHVPVKIPIFAHIKLMQSQDDLHSSHAHRAMQSTIFSPTTLENNECATSNVGGLKQLFTKARNILPLKKIQLLTLKALANDKEVQALKNLITTVEFRQLLTTLKQTNEKMILADYVCHKLHLKLKDYVQFARALLNFNAKQSDNNNVTAQEDFKGRAGVRGLLQDIRDIIPKQQLKDLYQRLLEHDDELLRAVMNLRSQEFRQLLQNFMQRDEYQKLRKMLMDAGLPLDELKDLIDVALGWKGNEFENEDIDTMI